MQRLAEMTNPHFLSNKKLFSLLDGFGQVEEFADRAPKINQKFLCVTDHGMMAAIPRQIRACKEHNLTPLFGNELYVQDGHPPKDIFEKMTAEEKKKIKKSYHLLAIAYNLTGYKNLVQLTSWAWLNGYYYRPRVTHEQLIKHKEGIIFTSCCYNGEIGQAFDKQGEDAAFAMIEKYMAMFGKDFYLELMLLDFNKQKPYDKFIVKAHDKYHIPVIVTNDCFVEDTVITTPKGSKFIQDVVVGDEVLTANGNFKEVQYVNERNLNIDEKVFRIKTTLGTIAFEATGNHPVLVAEVAKKRWNIQRKEIKSQHWKDVSDLKIGDYLVVPKIDDDKVFAKHHLEELDIFPFVNKVLGKGRGGVTFVDNEFVSSRGFSDKYVKIPRKIKIDEDFLKVLGLYLSEGGLDKNGTPVSFALHVREKVESEILTRFFSQFGISVYETIIGNSRKIAFSSVIFHEFFENFCGMGCLNKNFNNIIRRFSKEQILTILAQYFKGDGHFPTKHGRASNITSVSKRMIFDVSFILNACGLLTLPCFANNDNAKHKNVNAKPENWNTRYNLASGGNHLIKLKNLLFDSNLNLEEKKCARGNKYVESDDCYALRINSIENSDYKNKVYNLQIADDETYLANFYKVHNCHYCEKEDSKFQRYMLMIQRKTSIKEIEKKLTEEDRQDIFELQDTNLWMKSERELNQKWLEMYQDTIPYDLYVQSKANTVKICHKAKGVELDRSIKLPQIPDADLKLKECVIEGAKWRNIPKTRKYADRLKEEYELITRKGFASYFLIQKQIIDEARRICPSILGWGDGSEAVGAGRGSCVASLISYCLGITDVDPIRHNLLFSRFLSPSRGGKSIKLKFSGK